MISAMRIERNLDEFCNISREIRFSFPATDLAMRWLVRNVRAPRNKGISSQKFSKGMLIYLVFEYMCFRVAQNL